MSVLSLYNERKNKIGWSTYRMYATQFVYWVHALFAPCFVHQCKKDSAKRKRNVRENIKIIDEKNRAMNPCVCARSKCIIVAQLQFLFSSFASALFFSFSFTFFPFIFEAVTVACVCFLFVFVVCILLEMLHYFTFFFLFLLLLLLLLCSLGRRFPTTFRSLCVSVRERAHEFGARLLYNMYNVYVW